MYPIYPVQKNYAWGSHSCLQTMFHLSDNATPSDCSSKQQPLAEMWFSAHPQSPSFVELEDGSQQPLTRVIQSNPLTMVGEHNSQTFGPVLPYLFKIISAEIPLSLQVHPLDFEARAGFNRENAEKVPLDDPQRSFKDTLAKHEMVVALERFSVSVGFAPLSTQLQILRAVDHPVAQRMANALVARTFRTGMPPQEFSDADALMPVASLSWSDSRRRVFRAFYTAITATPSDRDTLMPALLDARKRLSSHKAHAAIDNALQAAQAFPKDLSVLCLLMMNAVCLEEGESVYIPAGTPHAYIHGTAAEIMTNSDNVLRAGMTPKHKDIPSFLHNLNCQTSSPIDPSSSMMATLAMHNMVTYRPHISEYMLVYGHVEEGSKAWPLIGKIVHRYGDLVQRLGSNRLLMPRRGPRILVCTEGSVLVKTQRQEATIQQGEALFIPSADGRVDVESVSPVGFKKQGSASTGSFLMASTPV